MSLNKMTMEDNNDPVHVKKSDELGLSKVGHILLQQSKYIYWDVIRMYRSI